MWKKLTVMITCFFALQLAVFGQDQPLKLFDFYVMDIELPNDLEGDQVPQNSKIHVGFKIDRIDRADTLIFKCYNKDNSLLKTLNGTYKIENGIPTLEIQGVKFNLSTYDTVFQLYFSKSDVQLFRKYTAEVVDKSGVRSNQIIR